MDRGAEACGIYMCECGGVVGSVTRQSWRTKQTWSRPEPCRFPHLCTPASTGMSGVTYVSMVYPWHVEGTA